MFHRRIVILDKNFLQSEPRSTPRTNGLSKCGCEFALTDTLIYELCSDKRGPSVWRSIQTKLFPFADRLHLWIHAAALLKEEIANNRPTSGPEDVRGTARLRDWFRSGSTYVPDDLSEIVEEAHQQREVATVEKIDPMARSFGHMITESARSSGFEILEHQNISQLALHNLNDVRLIRWAINSAHGNPASVECHIPDAADRITPD